MEDVSNLSYKIFYLTGWKSPRIHFSCGEKSKWQNEPLQPEPRKKNCYFFEVKASSSIEFVFCNDSKTAWDNNSGKNYKIQENGEDCLVFKKTIVRFNKTPNTTSFVFSIDLDGTLLGDALAMKEFEICWLRNCFFDSKKLLVYNTGRNFKSAVDILKEHFGLMPDVFINSCGTEIFLYDAQTMDYQIEETWKLKQAISFPVKDIEIELKKLGEWILSINVNDLRISFTAKINDLNQNMSKLMEIKSLFSDKKIDIIISGYGEYRYIDLLSSDGGKGKALKHLISFLKMNDANSYAFGDSLNDVDMLEMANFGIVVSNLQEDLVRYIHEKKLINVEFSQFNNANAILNKLKGILGEA